jgi:hypothetical protein
MPNALSEGLTVNCPAKVSGTIGLRVSDNHLKGTSQIAKGIAI